MSSLSGTGTRTHPAESATAAGASPGSPAVANTGRGTPAAPAMFVAVCANELGVVVQAAGPFLDEADAKTYASATYGAQGYAAPLEVVFRSP